MKTNDEPYLYEITEPAKASLKKEIGEGRPVVSANGSLWSSAHPRFDEIRRLPGARPITSADEIDSFPTMRGDLTNRVQGLSKLMDQVSDDELRTLDPDFKSRENYATTWQVNLKNLRMMAQQGADKELVGQYQQLRNQWAIDHGRLSEYLKTRKGAAQFFMVDEVADRSGTYPAQMAVDRVWEREAPGQGARMAHYIRTRKMEGAAVQKAIQGLETKFPSTGGGTDLFRMSESDAIRYGKEAVSRYFKPGSDKPASLAAVVADMLAEKNEKEERTLFTGKEAGTYFNVVYQHASRYMEGVQQRLTPALLKSTYNALRTTKASMDGIVGQQKTPSSVFGAMVMDLTEDLLEDPRLKTNIPARVDAFFKDKLNDEQYSMYENVVGRMQSGGGRLPSNAPPEALALQDQIVMVQESVKLKLKVDAKQVADERKAINEIQARKIEAIEQVGGVGIPHPIDGRVMPLRAGKYANDLIEAMAAAKGDPEKQAELWTAASRSLAGNQQQLTQTLSEYQYLHQKRSAMIMEAQATGKTEEQIRAQLSGTANQSESEGSTTLAILEHLRGTGAFQIPFGSPTEEQLRNNEATYFDPFFTNQLQTDPDTGQTKSIRVPIQGLGVIYKQLEDEHLPGESGDNLKADLFRSLHFMMQQVARDGRIVENAAVRGYAPAEFEAASKYDAYIGRERAARKAGLLVNAIPDQKNLLAVAPFQSQFLKAFDEVNGSVRTAAEFGNELRTEQYENARLRAGEKMQALREMIRKMSEQEGGASLVPAAEYLTDQLDAEYKKLTAPAPAAEAKAKPDDDAPKPISSAEAMEFATEVLTRDYNWPPGMTEKEKANAIRRFSAKLAVEIIPGAARRWSWTAGAILDPEYATMKAYQDDLFKLAEARLYWRQHGSKEGLREPKTIQEAEGLLGGTVQQRKLHKFTTDLAAHQVLGQGDAYDRTVWSEMRSMMSDPVTVAAILQLPKFKEHYEGVRREMYRNAEATFKQWETATRSEGYRSIIDEIIRIANDPKAEVRMMR